MDGKVTEVLNLGAGVQSTTVLMMSIHGELPKLDYAIFADTGWEPKAVYEHLEWLKEQCESSGIKMAVVSNGNIRKDQIQSRTAGKRCASLPYFTKNKSSETEGMVRRQCTDEYKITPIDQYVKKEILGLRPRQRTPQNAVVRQWFGISFDERIRQRTCGDRWRRFYYPLIQRDKPMTRLMCLDWMERHRYPQPPRSACIGCPYHSNQEWRDMKNNRPEEFSDAIQFDLEIRNHPLLEDDSYLHRSRKPLREVDFRNDFDKGQLPLFDDECEGMCGV